MLQLNNPRPRQPAFAECLAIALAHGRHSGSTAHFTDDRGTEGHHDGEIRAHDLVLAAIEASAIIDDRHQRIANAVDKAGLTKALVHGDDLTWRWLIFPFDHKGLRQSRCSQTLANTAEMLREAEKAGITSIGDFTDPPCLPSDRMLWYRMSAFLRGRGFSAAWGTPNPPEQARGIEVGLMWPVTGSVVDGVYSHDFDSVPADESHVKLLLSKLPHSELASDLAKLARSRAPERHLVLTIDTVGSAKQSKVDAVSPASISAAIRTGRLDGFAGTLPPEITHLWLRPTFGHEVACLGPEGHWMTQTATTAYATATRWFDAIHRREAAA